MIRRCNHERPPLKICDLHDDVGTIRKTIAGLRATHLAEPHHDALDAALVTMSEALETFHRAEGIAIAAFNKRVTP